MKQQLNNQAESYISNKNRHDRLRRIVALLSAVVMFLTMNSLKMNADTLERIPTCGISAHVHSEDCYDSSGALICGRTEHVHTDACYQQRPTRANAADLPMGKYVALNATVNLVTPSPAPATAEETPVDEPDTEPVDEYGDEGTEDAPVDAPIQERAAVLGEDGSVTTIGTEDEDTGDDDVYVIETEEYTYEIADQAEVLVSQMIEAAGMPLDVSDVLDIGLADEDEAAASLIRVEAIDGDFIVAPVHSFDALELALITEDDILVIKLTNAIVAEQPEETVEQPADEENGETDESGEAIEENQDDETENTETPANDENTTGDNADDETVDENNDETSDENNDDETIDETAGETASETDVIGNGNVTIAGVDGNTLPADSDVAYDENVDKDAAIEELNRLLGGRRRMMMAAPSRTTVGIDQHYAVFGISITSEGETLSETGAVEVTVYPDDVDLYAGLPEGAVATKVSYVLYHVHDGAADELPVRVVENGGVVESVTFTTDSFSNFILKYTVDFEYVNPETGETIAWSFPGEGSYSVASILAKLGVTGEIGDVSLARTVDVGGADNALFLEQKDGEWFLTSEAAFQDTFELTVIVDGAEYVLVITDEAEDLSTAATLGLDFSVVDKGESTATYNAGSQSYDMQLKVDFTIPSDYITVDGKTEYKLDFASGIKIPQEYLGRTFSAYDSVTGDESFTYKLVQVDGGKYQLLAEFTPAYIASIKDDSRTIGKNSVTIDISVGSSWLQEDGKLKGDVIENREITVTPDKITYPEGTDGKHDLSVTKTFGGYDKTTHKMKYTLVVSSSLGTAGPITVSDHLTVEGGSNISVNNLEVISVKTGVGNEYYLNDVKTPVSDYTATPSADKTGLTITLPQATVEKGQPGKTVYLVEYEYELDGVGDDFESKGKNEATATDNSVTAKGEAWWNISQAGIALNKNGQYDAEKGTITWTINVTNNKNSDIPLQDDALKGLQWSNLTITPSASLSSDSFDSDTGTLTIPAGGSYVITYTTTPTIPDATVETKVTNKVTAGDPGDGQKTAEPSVTVPREASVSKELASVSRNGDNAILTWRVKIHVPKTGFAAGTTFTEELDFFQNYIQASHMASFTDGQVDALVAALKGYFGEVFEVEYTPSSKVDVDYGYTITAAKLVMKFTEDWPGEENTSEYLGQDVVIEYQTSANLAELNSDNNSYENKFSLNNISSTASYSFKERVVKLAVPGNAADVTTADADKDNNKLHWYIQVALEDDARSITVNDTLPDGLKVTSIRMGDGPYNLIGLVENPEGVWAGETATDWPHGVPAWSSTYMSDSTPSATVNGQNVTITLSAADHVPEYFKANDIFYFYIEAEIDESQFPPTGTKVNEYKNTASVSVDNVPYGTDDQTQKVTLKTSIIDKSGDSSVWNAQNGAHELSYVVDINPTGAKIAGEDGQITLTDHIEYYNTVKDNQGNAHKVSLNLKEGSAKLQRKDSNGQWVDIPPTEGWGYTLNENATSPSDNIKAKEIQIYGIPDEMVLRFVYVYNVEVDGLPANASVNLGAIKNTATLHAVVEESSSHTESKDWKNITSTGTTESTGSMTIVKVQDGNYAITLPDTLFVLEVFEPDGSGVDSKGTWKPVSAVGSTVDGTGAYAGIKVFKTNANGKLTISADPTSLGTAGNYQYDTLYRVREYEAHEGYTLDKVSPEAVYFYFGRHITEANAATELKGYHYSGASTHADDLLREADTVYMTNQRVTDTITGTKQWNSSSVWPSEIIQIELMLVKANGDPVDRPSSYSVGPDADGKYYTEDDTTHSNPWTNPQVLTKDNQQAVWTKLDVDTKASNPFEGYRIVETGIRYTAGDSTTVDLERRDLGNNQYQWVKKDDGEVLFETFGGKVTNGMGTIVNMSKTRLEVEKSWGTQGLGADSQLEVVMTLVAEERMYAQNGVIQNPLPNWQGIYKPVEDIEPIVLDGATETVAWQGAFVNLDKFRYDENTGILYEIRYSVQETVREKNGRDVTDRYLAKITYNANRDKVTVTNTDDVGELEVVKVWQRRTNDPGDLPDEIYISIERYYEENGVRHNDGDFNADHRGIRITAADTIDGGTTPWAKLFENLQRQVVVDGQTYDYFYVVKEDNVPGYTKVIASDGVTLKDGSDGSARRVTVTNVENEELYVPEKIDIHLEKLFTDEDGELQYVPEGATATFRLYRYIIVETGTYDAVTRELTPDEPATRMEDAAFNSPDNDSTWTHVLSVDGGTHVTDGGDDYSWFEDDWTDLPISEIYYNNGTYVKNTYEYYLEEKEATDSEHHAYTALYMEDGSKDRPITIKSDGTEVANGNDVKIAEVWNVESDKTFTIRKYWFGLDEEFMPGIVVKFRHQSDGVWSDVSAFGTSSNGAATNGNTEFKLADGTVFKGYLLSNANEWNISFAGLEEGGEYDVIEVGYLTKNASGEDVVVEFSNEYFEVSNRYNYTTELNYVYDITGFNYDRVRNTFISNAHSTSNNYGTIGICNAPKHTGSQLYLQKRWYSFTGKTGFANITGAYDGKGDGDKETYIVMQVYQRPYWAFEDARVQDGVYVTDWIEFGDPIKYAVSEVIANGFEWNGGGGQWHLQIMNDKNMPLFGYMPDSDGVIKLVKFDYKWVEIGQIPGSDGRTYRTYYVGYPDEPENHRDDPGYYETYNGKQIIENYETGLLLLIKEWKAQNRANRIFYSVVDDRGHDIAKEVYEASDKSFYGVTAKDVAYIPELGKYVFVLDSRDAVSDNRWELMIRGLDIVKDVDPVTHEGFGEVTYTVEEVGVEVTEGTGDAATKVVYAVTDSNYPYNTSYYRRVRDNGEEFAGSTANNDDGERLSASGLQLDSARAYNETGSLTWARTVNSDEPTTQLKVEKKWPGPGDQYPTSSVKIVLNLQQRRQATKKDASGNYVPLWEDDAHTIPKWVDGSDWQAAEGTTRVSVTLPLAGYSGANAWTYTWKGLPIYKVTGEMGAQYETPEHDILWYRVIESSSPDWTSSTLTMSGSDNVVGEIGATGDKQHPINMVLTNAVDSTNIHIEKQWTNTYAAEKDQSETYAEDGTINWPEGYAISYKVVRHAWIVSATEGESTKVDYPEDKNREDGAPTSYEQKTVTYTDGFEVEEWMLDPLMEGYLSASNPSFDLTGQPKGAVITTDDDPPTGLSKNTTYVVEYVYEIVETAITTPYGTQEVELHVATDEKTDKDGSYNKDPDGVVQGDAIITNDLTNIEVEKVWTLNGGSYTPTGDESVTVQLYRSKERPEGAIPVTPGKITIYVDPLDGQGRSDLANGEIVVTVTGDNGFTQDYTLSGPSYSIETDELPDIAEATGGDITYTVTVKSVDDTVIETAIVNGDGSTVVGGKVTLTAKAVTPPKTFTLNFSPSWVYKDNWDNSANEPNDGRAWIKVKLNYTLNGESKSEEITLNSGNKWGRELNKQLLVSDANGVITYNIQYQNTSEYCDNEFVTAVKDEKFNPSSFTGSADETKTVTYIGAVPQQSSGGGESGGGQESIIKTYSVAVTEWRNGADQNNYSGNADVASSGRITVTIQTDWYGTAGTVVLNPENGWAAEVEIDEAKLPGYVNGERIGTSAYGTPSDGINAADCSMSGNTIQVIEYYNVASSRSARTFAMAKAPVLRAAATKSVTILGQNDLTPIDAVPVGDPITLSGDTWSYAWNDLPRVDENGDPIYYYVRELSANIPADAEYTGTTYDYTKHNDGDAREGYGKITVTNNLEREEPKVGSVKVTKNFTGITAEEIPTNFQIVATWDNDGKQTRTLTISGDMASDVTRTGSGLSYTWEIADLPIGTEVSFEESGYDVTGYSVTINGEATASTLTATAAVVPGEATFTNEYSRGGLMITKNVTVNGAAPAGSTLKLADGTYTFTITDSNGQPAVGNVDGNPITDGKVTITITNGEANSVVVTDLAPGDYTITETATNGLTLTAATGGKSVTDKVVTVTVTGGKNAKADLADDAKAEFTNNKPYVTDTPEATKTLNGKAFTGKNSAGNDVTFTFTLKPVTATDNDGTVTYSVGDQVQEKTTGANGAIAFDAIEFTEAGEYVYQIAETAGDEKNMVYADPVYVKFTVIDDGNGVLTATHTYYSDMECTQSAGSATFNNVELGELNVSKTVEMDGADELPDAVKNRAFPFTVKFTKEDGAPYAEKAVTLTITTDGTAGTPETLTTDAEGKVTFNLTHGQTANLADLPVGIGYTVAEDLTGITNYSLVSVNNDATTTRAIGRISTTPGSAAFVNKTTRYSFTKKWTGLGDATAWTVTYRLERKIQSPETWNTVTIDGEDSWTISKDVENGNLEAPVTVTIDELPYADDHGNVYTYRAVETAYTYTVGGTAQSYTVTIPAEAVSGVDTIKNDLTSITVSKQWMNVDGTAPDNPATTATATVDLYRVGTTDPIQTGIVITYDTDAETWKWTSGPLPKKVWNADQSAMVDAEYYVIETATSDTTYPITLVTYKAGEGDTPTDQANTHKTSEDNGTLTVINRKQSSYTLPSTGGAGTTAIYVGGASLMMLAVLAYIWSNRKRFTGDEE